jgi:hypothetical protein
MRDLYPVSPKTRVADQDPDPDWIRIQSGQWIQIRNPKSGINVLKFWMTSFEIGLDPDPYWIRIRIGIQPKMLDPDPAEMNADPQPCPKHPDPLH